MKYLDDVREPTEAELWAIEADSEVLAAELTVVDAESAWCRSPSEETAANYLQALLDLVDLRELTDHRSPHAA